MPESCLVFDILCVDVYRFTFSCVIVLLLFVCVRSRTFFCTAFMFNRPFFFCISVPYFDFCISYIPTTLIWFHTSYVGFSDLRAIKTFIKDLGMIHEFVFEARRGEK